MTMADLNTTTSTTGSIPTAANKHRNKRPARANARPSDPQRPRRPYKEATARNRLQKELRSDLPLKDENTIQITEGFVFSVKNLKRREKDIVFC